MGWTRPNIAKCLVEARAVCDGEVKILGSEIAGAGSAMSQRLPIAVVWWIRWQRSLLGHIVRHLCHIAQLHSLHRLETCLIGFSLISSIILFMARWV